MKFKIRRLIHKVRMKVDRRYRKRVIARNKIFKQHYGPIIISGLYEENLLMKRLRENEGRKPD